MEIAIRIYSHFTKCPVDYFANSLRRGDNQHKPGGLWLSDESDYGWSAFVLEQVRKGNSEWADGKDILRYRYDLVIDPEQEDSVLVLQSQDDLREFTSAYREASYRQCTGDSGKAEYGLHIEWERVKAEYKGILITPYQRELSHRNGDPDFHWYRFDCASGCIWDISCLRVLHWEIQTEWHTAT